MRRLRKILLIALAALFGLVVLVVVAWAVDTRRHDDRVTRNVDLAGVSVGGMTRAQLANAVASVKDDYDNASVHVIAPKGSFVIDAAALGVRLKEPETVDATMSVGRSGGLLHELGSWLRGVLTDRRAPVYVSVDAGAVYTVVPREDPGPQKPPEEPSITLEGDKMVAVDGKDGEGIDPAEVIETLPDAAKHGTPIQVRVHRGDVPPRFDKEDAEKLAEEATRLTRNQLTVKAGSKEAKVPVKTLRSWLRAEAKADGLKLAVKPDAATKDLAELLPAAGASPTETGFNLVEGRPVIIPGKPGTACCSTDAAELVKRAVEEQRTSPLTLPLKRVDPKLTVDQADALNIKEPVGAFTTQHKCCEPRVTNIHKMADTLRGHVIKPGETFSINEVVGRRTREKGYVVAGVIQDGIFAEDVGGGVSQFATTLFNAAFFAGLDFGEYQSHSIYISRYPRGREATMGYPHPDLQIKNTTPHGILMWPSYNSTSITITLYSTKFVESTQSGQTEAPRGPCTRVSTERTRKYLDGTTKVDRVFALYRPAEGVNCPTS